MSFSSELKQELALIQNQKDCCDLSELSAITQAIGGMSIKNGSMQLRYETYNLTLAKRTLILLRKKLKLEVLSHVNKEKLFGGRYLSVLRLSPEDSRQLLLMMNIIKEGEKGEDIYQGAPQRIVRRNCCTRAYIRAMFLGCGSMSDPRLSYRASFSMVDEARAQFFIKVLKTVGIEAKLSKSRDKSVLYIKQKQQLSLLLRLMGANRAAIKMEDSLMQKEAKQLAQRAINCDTANIKKQLEAAKKQVDAINKISKLMGLSSLPEDLEKIARLRLLNSEISLTALAQMLDISKAQMQNRIKKILAFADNIDKNSPTKLKE